MTNHADNDPTTPPIDQPKHRGEEEAVEIMKYAILSTFRVWDCLLPDCMRTAYRALLSAGFIAQDERLRKAFEGGGTSPQAIHYALTLDDHFEMREFLDGWMHGDIAEWADDYRIFLEVLTQGDTE